MKSKITPDGTLALERGRVMDYLSLAKPELTSLSVLTALAGFILGMEEPLRPLLLVHTLLGTAMVGGAAGALNQLIERRYDAMMRRTEQRPLPSGRLMPVEALLFGCIMAATGVAELLLFVNPLSAFLAAGTLVSYLFLYTPLKRITPHATIVGALPGAIPPLIGWAASHGSIDAGGLLLFGILFFWQMPHFLSLAWMYRRDYARAGYRLLAVVDPGGKRSGAQGLAHTVALVVMTALPWWRGMFGAVYLVGALLAGGLFLAAGWKLYTTRSNTSARRVFAASLAYLPALMALMVLDRLAG